MCTIRVIGKSITHHAVEENNLAYTEEQRINHQDTTLPSSEEKHNRIDGETNLDREQNFRTLTKGMQINYAKY